MFTAVLLGHWSVLLVKMLHITLFTDSKHNSKYPGRRTEGLQGRQKRNGHIRNLNYFRLVENASQLERFHQSL